MRRMVLTLSAAVLLATLLLPACSSSLTGGSIPPGSVFGRASGVVVRGDNATASIPNATVRVEPLLATSREISIGVGGGTGGLTPPPLPTPGGSGSSGGPVITPPVGEVPGTVITTTNARGQFTLGRLPTGPVRLTVTPPGETGLASISYLLTIGAGESWQILAAPQRQGQSLAGLSGIEVSPTAIALVQGRNVPLTTRLIGGAPPTVVPSYLLRGTMGVINTQGWFTAVAPGSGTLRVVVGPYQQTVPIQVTAR